MYRGISDERYQAMNDYIRGIIFSGEELDPLEVEDKGFNYDACVSFMNELITRHTIVG